MIFSEEAKTSAQAITQAVVDEVSAEATHKAEQFVVSSFDKGIFANDPGPIATALGPIVRELLRVAYATGYLDASEDRVKVEAMRRAAL